MRQGLLLLFDQFVRVHNSAGDWEVDFRRSMGNKIEGVRFTSDGRSKVRVLVDPNGSNPNSTWLAHNPDTFGTQKYMVRGTGEPHSPRLGMKSGQFVHLERTFPPVEVTAGVIGTLQVEAWRVPSELRVPGMTLKQLIEAQQNWLEKDK